MAFNFQQSVNEIESIYSNVDPPNNPGNQINDLVQYLVQPETILDEDIFDRAKQLIHAYDKLTSNHRSQLLYGITGAMKQYVEKELKSDLDSEDTFNIEVHRDVLQLYAYLIIFVFYCISEEKDPKKKVNGAASASDEDIRLKKGFQNSIRVLIECFKTLSVVFSVDLSHLFETTISRDDFVNSLCLKPVNSLFESEERMKDESFRRSAFKVLCQAVNQQGQMQQVQSNISSNLIYFPHLSPFKFKDFQRE
ncbi:unnamed protein product [Ambrosiozyma monospora]|uniref:Unnamed protein product n=1 Tax=Ambrosiozyma monospora TaxID=43982 RepID=A0A9W7DP90_AMBMO|nr:unnamed protein product [Ambrosiozyma monospora]